MIEPAVMAHGGAEPGRAGELRPIASPPRPSPLVRVAAPLVALAYPGLVWCGPKVHPLFLLLALAVPAIGLGAALRLQRGGSPAARLAAHLAVAAPPLYTLGAWLDFQPAIPLKSLGAWFLLWPLLALAALIDRRASRPIARRPRLAVLHGVAAALIALFAVAHLANHLVGLAGGEAHVAVMHALRAVYRHRLVEPLLLALLLFQIASGALLLRARSSRADGWFDALQTTTGAYLLVFLLSHVSATLGARLLRHRDTDWSWLAGGELLTDPWSARLVPYYFLGVALFAVHIGCGLRTVLLGHGAPEARARAAVIAVAAAGAVGSALILIGLFRA